MQDVPDNHFAGIASGKGMVRIRHLDMYQGSDSGLVEKIRLNKMEIPITQFPLRGDHQHGALLPNQVRPCRHSRQMGDGGQIRSRDEIVEDLSPW